MHTRTAIAGLLTTAALLTACGTSTPDPASVSPAQKLADLDGDHRPAADYQSVLDDLTPKCTQKPEGVAALAHGTLTVLQQDGFKGDTEYSVLADLNKSVPAGTAPMDCKDISASYLILREG